jgi:hypothetical protein
MSMLRRLSFICTLLFVNSVLVAQGAGWLSKTPANQNEPSNLVDLSGASLSGHSATTQPTDLSFPLVDTASKSKKKPAPSFWSRMVHPTQWFSSSKKK